MITVNIWNENTAFAGLRATDTQAEKFSGDITAYEFANRADAEKWVAGELEECAKEIANRPGANVSFRMTRASTVYAEI